MKLIGVFCIFCVIFESRAQLYSSDDNVTNFNPALFESTFNDKLSQHWFLQFYHPYCGHCINFSPKFKEAIKEGKYWKAVINFGVVDCHNDRSLCLSQGVKRYPTFKVYVSAAHPDFAPRGLIQQINRETTETFLHSVIGLIEKYIRPVQLVETRELTDEIQKPYFYLTGGNLLDLKRAVLKYSGRLTYRLLYKFIENAEEYELVTVLRDSSKSKKYSNLEELFRGLDTNLQGKAIEDAARDNAVTIAPLASRNKSDTGNIPVYNQDMYASIMYALTLDITEDKLNTPETKEILSNFLKSLFHYSGFKAHCLDSFKRLITSLNPDANSDSETESKSWDNMIKSAAFPKVAQEWIGCKGSKLHFRRYPCGLWTTFHTLTVNNYLKNKDDESDNSSGRDLIKSIVDFVVTFFSCRGCAENFAKETSGFEDKVDNAKSAVLYLWNVHNDVNKRLARQPSEDPEFPKIEFPSYFACPKCRRFEDGAIKWNETNVFDFLVNRFSHPIETKIK